MRRAKIVKILMPVKSTPEDLLDRCKLSEPAKHLKVTLE